MTGESSGPEARQPRSGFGDRLAAQVAQRRSQLVLGLDPDPARLWPSALELTDTSLRSRTSGSGSGSGSGARSGSGAGPGSGAAVGGDRPAARAARAVAAHCRLLLEAAGDHCVAVKPQLACFERLGAPGWDALAEVVRDAADRGLLVLADGKRGDIDISARAYGQAFFGGMQTPFGQVEGLGADALTVSPLLGRDSLAPLIEAARPRGAGVFALVRTSNPGAAEIQDRSLAEGGTVSGALAQLVDALGAPGVGSSGLSDVGAVIGATVPAQLEALRALMPHTIVLLPGIGPQGATGRELASAFAPGPAAGLVAASRAIAYAFERTTAGSGSAPAAAASAEAARLRELLWGLYA